MPVCKCGVNYITTAFFINAYVMAVMAQCTDATERLLCVFPLSEMHHAKQWSARGCLHTH
jgi:hypothetical protein